MHKQFLPIGNLDFLLILKSIIAIWPSDSVANRGGGGGGGGGGGAKIKVEDTIPNFVMRYQSKGGGGPTCKSEYSTHTHTHTHTLTYIPCTYTHKCMSKVSI